MVDQIKKVFFIFSCGIIKSSSDSQFLLLIHLFIFVNLFFDRSQLVIVTTGVLHHCREQKKTNRVFSLLNTTYLRFNQSSKITFLEFLLIKEVYIVKC
jgi:hypothetical protein